jgi:hypothetical protein
MNQKLRVYTYEYIIFTYTVTGMCLRRKAGYQYGMHDLDQDQDLFQSV